MSHQRLILAETGALNRTTLLDVIEERFGDMVHDCVRLVRSVALVHVPGDLKV